MSRPTTVTTCMLRSPKCCDRPNGDHFNGTYAPVEEPSTASFPDSVAHYAGGLRQKGACAQGSALRDRGVRIEQHQQGEGDYRTTLEALISVASRAAEIF